MTISEPPPHDSSIEEIVSHSRAVRWRLWVGAAAILMSALAANLLFQEWNWGAEDFVILAALLFGGCGCVEVVSRLNVGRTYLGGFGLLLLGMMLLAWINLAVGVIGSEDHPGNRMFHALPVIALLGALIFRFRPRGLAMTMTAVAAGHFAIAVIAYVTGMAFIFPMTGAFIAVWMTSAWLFRKSAAEVLRT